MNGSRRLGLFGGSFNPVHLGHLIMAEHARIQLDLDRVLFAPAGNPPHKTDEHLASISDRMAMVRLAIAGNEGFACSDLDTGQKNPSFTWRLLEMLREEQPGAELWFIMGSDSLADFPSWARPERILELARLAVIDRPEVTFDAQLMAAVPGLTGRVDHIEAPPCAISSTDIRRRIERNGSVRYLVPDAVRAYVDRHGLYRADIEMPSRGAYSRLQEG